MIVISIQTPLKNFLYLCVMHLFWQICRRLVGSSDPLALGLMNILINVDILGQFHIYRL